MLAIFKREFKSYFRTLIAPIAIDIILVFGLIFFQMSNIRGASSNLANTMFLLCMYGFSFAIPILCMRSLADEKRTRTDQLLLTAPVSAGRIVLGKFLALSAVVAIPLAMFCLLPPVMKLFGTVPFRWNYVNILAVMLYAMMIIAISIFMSSLTESATIAAVFSMLVTFIGLIIGDIYGNIQNEIVKNVLSSVYDFGDRLTTLLNGSLDWTSVVYLISVTALFLFLTTQSLKKRRYIVSRHNMGLGLSSAAVSVLVIAVVVVVNVAAAHIPDKYRAIDVTDNGSFSLDHNAVQIARDVQDDITIYMMGKQETAEQTNYVNVIVRNIKMYAAENSNIKFQYVDLETEPDFAKTYTTESVSDFDVIVVDNTNGRSQLLTLEDMLVLQTDYQTYSRYITGYDCEGQIARALQYVQLTDDQLVKAYILTGHNEDALDSTFAKVLSKANVSSEDLSLMTSDAVPEDCSLLIINEPKTDLNDDEVSKIEDYAGKGGNILFVSDFLYKGSDNQNKLLSYYGINNTGKIIYENDPEHFYHMYGQTVNTALLPVTNSASDISNGLGTTDTQIIADIATEMVYNADENADVTYTNILTSSDKAQTADIVQTSYGSQAVPSGDEGTIVLGVKAEKKISDDVTSTAVVYSSSTLFSATTDSLTGGSNQVLFSNTVKSLVSLDNTFVTIPQEMIETGLNFTQKGFSTLNIVWWGIIAFILIFGIVVWAQRRHM